MDDDELSILRLNSRHNDRLVYYLFMLGSGSIDYVRLSLASDIVGSILDSWLAATLTALDLLLLDSVYRFSRSAYRFLIFFQLGYLFYLVLVRSWTGCKINTAPISFNILSGLRPSPPESRVLIWSGHKFAKRPGVILVTIFQSRLANISMSTVLSYGGNVLDLEEIFYSKSMCF